MSRIRQRDTAPEIVVRHGLHRLGLRYRLNVKGLPGRPDLLFPRHGAAVFVHGCFWHSHCCRAGRAPTTNTEYWTPKLEANVMRDRRKAECLRRLGWRVITVWECQLKDAERARATIEGVARKVLGFD